MLHPANQEVQLLLGTPDLAQLAIQNWGVCGRPLTTSRCLRLCKFDWLTLQELPGWPNMRSALKKKKFADVETHPAHPWK